MADSTIKIRVNADLVKTLGVLGATTVPLADLYQLTIPNGTANGQADQIIPLQYAIAASGTQNIDVDALATVFGDAADAAEIVAILIYHDSASLASAVTLSGDLLNTEFGGTVSKTLPKSDFLGFSRVSAGMAVSGTADVITIVNADGVNVATVKLIIFARSA